MKPEVLLKAYVLYQSDDAFRELVAGSLGEVYSIALRIVQGPEHLVEETVLRVYWKLARKAASLGENVEFTSWLREHTCKIAVVVLRENERSIDQAALKKEKEALSTSNGVPVAPPGLVVRVCQGILLNTRRHKGLRLSLRKVSGLSWGARLCIGAGAVCMLAIVVVWKVPFHKRNPIIQSQSPQMQMTPSSFAQLGSPEDGGALSESIPVAMTNAATTPRHR
jgi:hypothetical protein